MAKASNDYLAYGLTIMVFGLIFLLDRTGTLALIPYGKSLLSIGSFFLIAGIIFLCARTEKRIGIILTAIGVIINSDMIFGWMRHYSSLIVPVFLIVAGIVMVLTAKH